MTSDADIIAAFHQLLDANPEQWVARHSDALRKLQAQLGDDDEKDAIAIASWLKDHNLAAAHEQILETRRNAPLNPAAFHQTQGISGVRVSPESCETKDLIDQAIQSNTQLPPSVPPSTPPSDRDREKPTP